MAIDTETGDTVRDGTEEVTLVDLSTDSFNKIIFTLKPSPEATGISQESSPVSASSVPTALPYTAKRRVRHDLLCWDLLYWGAERLR